MVAHFVGVGMSLGEDPPATQSSWIGRAACRGKDPAWWHPDTARHARTIGYSRARPVCEVCPVRAECLAFALAQEAAAGWGVNYRSGMWGGLTERERQALEDARWDRCRGCGGRYEGRWGAWCSTWCRDRGRAALRLMATKQLVRTPEGLRVERPA